eukprot:3611173-Prymnesium_polylepis.1
MLDCLMAGLRRPHADISLEDFYDALVRMATMMTLPTDDDVKQHGHSDAGAMLLDLSERSEMVWRARERE